MTTLKIRSEHSSFDGVQGFYEHESSACGGPMRFAVYLPPSAVSRVEVPAVYFLAGLTCTEETFATKAGAQRAAARLGVAIVTCDTSPRHVRYPGDDDHWDFGLGAGFYVDATEPPWNGAYKMESYVTRDLLEVVEANFPIRANARGIFGHSMGGHGALTLALRHPGLFTSVSAFAPIVAPSRVPWGQKAFSRYLGGDQEAWRAYDAVELLATRRHAGTLLVDQGTADKFLDTELKPEALAQACATAKQPLDLGLRDGYDHSYYFISSFVESHLEHHAKSLR